MDKASGLEQSFNKYKESELATIRNNEEITTFDMGKLEVEWDYDTDAEQIKVSHRVLTRDLFAAVEFFVKDDPINLIENTNIWSEWYCPYINPISQVCLLVIIVDKKFGVCAYLDIVSLPFLEFENTDEGVA